MAFTKHAVPGLPLGDLGTHEFRTPYSDQPLKCELRVLEEPMHFNKRVMVTCDVPQLLQERDNGHAAMSGIMHHLLNTVDTAYVMRVIQKKQKARPLSSRVRTRKYRKG